VYVLRLALARTALGRACAPRGGNSEHAACLSPNSKDPAHRALVSELSTRLEALIDAEIGSDSRTWVPERPRLVGWSTWRGDAA
jgi:arylsulfatase